MVLDLVLDHPGRDTEPRSQIFDIFLTHHTVMRKLLQADRRCKELCSERAPLLLSVRMGGCQKSI